MTRKELLELDVRRGKASMDWYRAARALYRGAISFEALIEAEDRAKELALELRRAMDTQLGGRSDE